MAPPLLALQHVSLHIGTRTLFEDVEGGIERGDRIGLVGRNGSGKSTLMKVLAGMIEPDGGDVFLQPRTAVAYLPQEPSFGDAATMRDYVLGKAPANEDSGSVEAQVESMLAWLGLDGARTVQNLSGGEARRLSIAGALIGKPQVLLLDEPTNHLDVTTIEWLEEQLRAYPGAMLLISHDRRLLADLTTKTWWLDRGTIRQSDRGYAQFEEWAEQVLEAEAAEWARLDKKIEAETHWLHRGVTARRKRNMGRLRNLDALREQRRGLIRQTGTAGLRAESTGSGGSLVIEAKGITKAFGNRVIVKDFSTRIRKGDRIGVVGPNGSGKTTLLGLLTGEMAPDSGTVRQGTELVIARFDQHRTQLDPDRTPWEALCPDGGDQVNVLGRWQHVVGYLRSFLFDESQARTPIRALSGGERNRLLLARILARPANLLVLDEPTNDLDMETLDLLQEVLDDYAGTVLVVSHDRDFLDRLVTSTIACDPDGVWREYAGGWTDYVRQRPAPPAPKIEKPRPEPVTAPAPAKRRFDPKLQRELDRLPDKIAAAEAKIAQTEQAMADPALYTRDPARFQALTETLTTARAELERLEERWLELEAEREALAG